MGPSQGERLNDHYEALRKATWNWLDYHSPITPQQENSLLFADWLTDETEEKDAPEAPEALVWVRQARNLGVPVTPHVSLWNMPYILNQELNIVVQTEEDHKAARISYLAHQAEEHANSLERHSEPA